MDNGTPLPLVGTAAKFVHRLLAIGGNRFQLLVVEVEEERDRVLEMIFYALVAAALGLLCGIAWTAALVVFFWKSNPGLILVILGVLYGTGAALICRRLGGLRDHQALSATMDQIRKDRACSGKN